MALVSNASRNIEPQAAKSSRTKSKVTLVTISEQALWVREERLHGPSYPREQYFPATFPPWHASLWKHSKIVVLFSEDR